jgi:hypothetical protein
MALQLEARLNSSSCVDIDTEMGTKIDLKDGVIPRDTATPHTSTHASSGIQVATASQPSPFRTTTGSSIKSITVDTL